MLANRGRKPNFGPTEHLRDFPRGCGCPALLPAWPACRPHKPRHAGNCRFWPLRLPDLPREHYLTITMKVLVSRPPHHSSALSPRHATECSLSRISRRLDGLQGPGSVKATLHCSVFHTSQCWQLPGLARWPPLSTSLHGTGLSGREKTVFEANENP